MTAPHKSSQMTDAEKRLDATNRAAELLRAVDSATTAPKEEYAIIGVLAQMRQLRAAIRATIEAERTSPCFVCGKKLVTSEVARGDRYMDFVTCAECRPAFSCFTCGRWLDSQSYEGMGNCGVRGEYTDADNACTKHEPTSEV